MSALGIGLVMSCLTAYCKFELNSGGKFKDVVEGGAQKLIRRMPFAGFCLLIDVPAISRAEISRHLIKLVKLKGVTKSDCQMLHTAM